MVKKLLIYRAVNLLHIMWFVYKHILFFKYMHQKHFSEKKDLLRNIKKVGL